MPKLAPDHIVVVVPDLNEAIEYFENRLGTKPIIGGKHIGLGTHNALLGLGNPDDSFYLELLAIDPSDTKKYESYPMNITLPVNGAYVVSWCIRCESEIEKINSDMKKMGDKYNFGDVRPMQRKTPAGEIISWKIASSNAQVKASHGQIPFLIQWDNIKQHPTARLNKKDNFCEYYFSIEAPESVSFENSLNNIGLKSKNIQFKISNQYSMTLELGANKEIVFTAEPLALDLRKSCDQGKF